MEVQNLIMQVIGSWTEQYRHSKGGSWVGHLQTSVFRGRGNVASDVKNALETDADPTRTVLTKPSRCFRALGQRYNLPRFQGH